MARKAAVGCLAVFALALLGGGAALWWFVARPAAATFRALGDLERLQEIRAGVDEDAPYEAPADGRLEPGQVERYLAVQEAVRAALEGRLATLEERYAALEAEGREPGPLELARAASDASRLLADAVRAQVDALNAHGFSLEEYDSVRSRVLAAAGLAVPTYDLAQLAAGAGDEAPERLGRDEPPPVPPENVDLVAPHRERLERALPFVRFGL